MSTRFFKDQKTVFVGCLESVRWGQMEVAGVIVSRAGKPALKSPQPVPAYSSIVLSFSSVVETDVL